MCTHINTENTPKMMAAYFDAIDGIEHWNSPEQIRGDTIMALSIVKLLGCQGDFYDDHMEMRSASTAAIGEARELVRKVNDEMIESLKEIQRAMWCYGLTKPPNLW